MKTESCKLYSRDLWIFLPNNIKIDRYNFELYRFKVGPFFETQCIVTMNVRMLQRLISNDTLCRLRRWHRCSNRRLSNIHSVNISQLQTALWHALVLHYLATALRWLAQLIPGRAVRELQTTNFFVWDRWKGTSEVNFSVDCPADSMTDCLLAYYNVLLSQFLRMVQLLLTVTWCLLVNFASN